jgi:hypothetical protein
MVLVFALKQKARKVLENRRFSRGLGAGERVADAAPQLDGWIARNPVASDLPTPGDPSSVIGLDTEVRHGGFAFRLNQRQVHCTEIRRAAVDQSRLGVAEEMGAIRLRIVSEEAEPTPDDAALLADCTVSARERIIAEGGLNSAVQTATARPCPHPRCG